MTADVVAARNARRFVLPIAAMLDELFPPWRDARVLCDDGDVIAVDKPAGVSTHAPDAGRHDDAVSRLQRWLAARHGGEPSAQYLGVHQRLDRDTSGVLVFARSRTANKGLAAAFEGRAASKTYVAVAPWRQGLAAQGTLVHDLVPADDGLMRALAPSSRPPPKAVRAVTKYRVLERHGARALLELRPETGRTHQLRVQCAAMGAPLSGDPSYGGEPAPRLMLHARDLTLTHPTRGAPVTFHAPVPRLFERWLRGEPDDAPLADRLRDAADRRYALATDPGTTAFRLAHDGDGVGAHVDLYDEHALVHFYTREGAPAVLDAVASLGVRGVYAKYRPKQANTLVDTRRDDVAPAHALRGDDAPVEFAVREHGLTYLVRLGDGLSTGVFLDQRENRRRVRELAKGRSVLNLFAYTCAFSVAAAAGGASRTVSVDASAASIEWGRRNLAANGLEGPAHVLVTADVFGWLEGARARRDRFDVIVLDPPSYSTAQGSRFSAESDYKKLAARCFALLSEGGALLACTNHRGIARMKFRRWLHEAARDAGREVTRLRDLPAPVDFPPAPGQEPHLKSALATVG